MRFVLGRINGPPVFTLRGSGDQEFVFVCKSLVEECLCGRRNLVEQEITQTQARARMYMWLMDAILMVNVEK